MNRLAVEPTISVGLLSGAQPVRFELHGDYIDEGGRVWPSGSYLASPSGGEIVVRDRTSDEAGRSVGPRLHLRSGGAASSFSIRDVTIGIAFHWEQRQDQEFIGRLRIEAVEDGRLQVINEIPLESYLTSVIASEMSATSDPELLKAHAIISRSWLLAQLQASSQYLPNPVSQRPLSNLGALEIIRWYDRENHTGFDVCADDHCQRYQGITTVGSPQVVSAVEATRGMVLTSNDRLCDARFSKSCGGMTERFSAAWDDIDYPYLGSFHDGTELSAEYLLPLSESSNAERWIRARPAAFCATTDQHILKKVLPDFDQATMDFYRWRLVLTQDDVKLLLREKLGIDLGAVRRLEPVERGGSGRIIRLRIVGENGQIVIGKELEIRRALSPSHLYSSAFVVDYGEDIGGAPASFTLIGAGWGHGVGLCQIGAAMMAESGYSFQEILGHYYRGAAIEELYGEPRRVSMGSLFYRFDRAERQCLLSNAGFIRNDLRVWNHSDGRSIGEGVAIAITDEAFFRFLQIEPPGFEEVSFDSFTKG